MSAEKLAEIMADPGKVEKMKKRDAVRNAKLQELAKKAFTCVPCTVSPGRPPSRCTCHLAAAQRRQALSWARSHAQAPRL